MDAIYLTLKGGDHLFANLPLLIFALTVALLVGLKRERSSPRTTLQQLQVAPSVRLSYKLQNIIVFIRDCEP